MSDVGAAILTLDEESTTRAIASVEAQAPAIREIHTVRNVTPFFRAMNEAARRVQSPFLLQVDADMSLDAGCVARLRGEMTGDTALVHAALRDPLRGDIVGVKLFRRECLLSMPYADSISSDTDFVDAVQAKGWRITAIAEALGEHEPDYSAQYCFRKFMLEGARYRYRGARAGLRQSIAGLATSVHPRASLALVALGHGFFQRWSRDGLAPLVADPLADRLVSFLGESPALEARNDSDRATIRGTGRLRDVFREGRARGVALSNDRDAFASALAILRTRPVDEAVTVEILGLAHGLLGAWSPMDRSRDSEHLLARFMALGDESRATGTSRLRAHARALARRLLLPHQRASTW
ncbi:MAG: glycosyl transferase family 2 [Gemmatimonadetes bacterium]|nr:glycosyl transferase family 2 [Gemmatimonadota bacterium]